MASLKSDLGAVAQPANRLPASKQQISLSRVISESPLLESFCGAKNLKEGWVTTPLFREKLLKYYL